MRTKKIICVVLVVLVLFVGLAVYIYIDSGSIDSTPSMVIYLRKYAGWDIKEISSRKSKEDGYEVVDTYFDMNGKYRFHYICKNRPGLKINDSQIGCTYYFDDGDRSGYSTFFDYFNEKNEGAVEDLIADFDGITGNTDWIGVSTNSELREFFDAYLELPEVADFYRVCFERRNSRDYYEFELSCNENFLRMGSKNSPQTLFDWAVEHNIRP